MTNFVRSLLCGVVMASAANADVLCSLTSLSSVEGTVGLADNGFRIRDAGSRLIAEHRLADGSWMEMGPVDRRVSGDFSVYLHQPEPGQSMTEFILMLSIHRSGNAVLVQHNSDFGNISSFR